MGISLTLTELKTYFEEWHKKISHKEEIRKVISEYLSIEKDGNNVSLKEKIDSVTSITDDIKTGLKAILLIEGHISSSNINLLSLEELKNEIENNRFTNNISGINLTALNAAIESLQNSITSKAEKEYVDDEIAELSNHLGVVPKQIQTQTIPVEGLGYDLNNYKIPGLYKCANAGNNIKNVPNIGSTFFNLVVLETKEETISGQTRYNVRQLLLTGESSESGNRIFSRNYTLHNNHWDDNWHELYGTHNAKPLQMKVEWDDNGNEESTIYTLLQIQ